MKKKFSIAIVGGGIGGCTAAIKASELKDVEVHLFEKKAKLLSGLPFCHLHSGGFLYPMINLQDCIQLLNHSLDFATLFSDCIDLRPTVVAYRDSIYDPNDLINKCKLISKQYMKFCLDSGQFPLGDPNKYYAVYTRDDIIYYKTFGKLPTRSNTESDGYGYHDKYVQHFCEIFDNASIDKIKYPFVSVMEPTILMDKVYNKITRLLNKNNVIINTNKSADLYELMNTFDYVINASGFENDNKNSKDSPLLELKSSWIIRNDNPKISDIRLPEIAIIGERGTENGMIQISQCEESNTFQIHAMTNDSTIFECVKDINDFSSDNLNIIYNNQIPIDTIHTRTKNGIAHISKLFSCFKNSDCNSENENNLPFKNTDYKIPCWGVQRITNTTKNTTTNTYKDNRVADVIFPKKNYAEIQIIKGISSVTAACKLTTFISSIRV